MLRLTINYTYQVKRKIFYGYARYKRVDAVEDNSPSIIMLLSYNSTRRRLYSKQAK